MEIPAYPRGCARSSGIFTSHAGATNTRLGDFQGILFAPVVEETELSSKPAMLRHFAMLIRFSFQTEAEECLAYIVQNYL